MSEENVEVVRAVIETWNSEDLLETSLESFHPEIEWFAREDAPDADVYRGHEGVRKLMAFWRETLADLRLDADEFIDHGEYVIGSIRVHGRGKSSGAPVELHYTNVLKMRDRRIVELGEFATKDEPSKPPSFRSRRCRSRT